MCCWGGGTDESDDAAEDSSHKKAPWFSCKFATPCVNLHISVGPRNNRITATKSRSGDSSSSTRQHNVQPNIPRSSAIPNSYSSPQQPQGESASPGDPGPRSIALQKRRRRLKKPLSLGRDPRDSPSGGRTSRPHSTPPFTRATPTRPIRPTLSLNHPSAPSRLTTAFPRPWGWEDYNTPTEAKAPPTASHERSMFAQAISGLGRNSIDARSETDAADEGRPISSHSDDSDTFAPRAASAVYESTAGTAPSSHRLSRRLSDTVVSNPRRSMFAEATQGVSFGDELDS